VTEGTSVRHVPRTWAELTALVASTLLAVALLGGFRSGPSAPSLSPDRASWILTPGVVNPDVTQETIGDTICKHGWTATVRPPTTYTNELKLEQMDAYHRAGTLSDYQEDHLISLELGGHPTDARNLWPEPVARATEVDTSVEDALNEKVCSGEITLREAQRREAEIKHTAG
jgi:hypothetical protein